jgi:hypothetical protein
MKAGSGLLVRVSYQQFPGQFPPPPPSGYAQPYSYPYPRPAPRPVNPLPAYIAGALFVGCALLSFVLAFVSWDGTGSPYVLAAVVGILYSGRVTGNVDFGISLTMTVACTTLTFAVILLARLALARWLLAALGGLIAAYYACAIVYLVAHGAVRLAGLPLVALFLWAAATGMALAPFTARAMRRKSFGV